MYEGWLPYEIQVYINGREWLDRQLDRAKVGYLRHDNSLLRIDNLDHAAEEAKSVRFLIRDRDEKFVGSFDEVFHADDIRILKSPVRSPRANAICERVIGTIRRECLYRVLILGRRHLEAVLADYIEHYNGHRLHRSLDQQVPRPMTAPPGPSGGPGHGQAAKT